jgi:L-ribulose-5-phosphate 4-epimerase
MAYDELKERTWQANIRLRDSGLIVLTWGNASEVDRSSGVFAIKPSGVSYEKLMPEDIVVLSLEDGRVVEGKLNPSSDTPTHAVLYREFPKVGGIVHTHSPHATAWAQAGLPIQCLGTTHADTFYGEIPVTRQLTKEEIAEAYEENTGNVVAELFKDRDPMAVPGVLLPYHGPVAWGDNAHAAATNAIILEEVAKIAQLTLQINPRVHSAPQCMLDKHYLRKHGPGAYYGQAKR